MKQLPKLSKAQQAAWAAALHYNERFPGQAFWWLPGHDTKQLHALTVKGMLTRTFSSTDETYRYTIHPDYLPASEPDAAPVAETTAAVEDRELEDAAPRFKVGDKVTKVTTTINPFHTTIVGVYPRKSESRWVYTIALADGSESLHEYDEDELKQLPTSAAELDGLRARVAELEASVKPVYDVVQQYPRFKAADRVIIGGFVTEIASRYPDGESGWVYSVVLSDSCASKSRFTEDDLLLASVPDEAQLIDGVNKIDALKARVAELEAASEQWEQSRDYWHTHYERALTEGQDAYQRAKRETERNILTSIEYAITRADEGNELAAVKKVIADWAERNNLQGK